jgi:hypothetical protein
MLKLFHDSHKGGLLLEAYEKPSNHGVGMILNIK